MPGGHAERLFVPETAEDIAAVLHEASDAGIPVTVSGARTGTVGGAVPFGGWVVSLERLNKIKRIDKATMTALVEPGVILAELMRAAETEGLFYPPDPTEWSCQIGGTVATNASGARSFKYGATREFVIGLTVVLADGDVLRLRRGDVFSNGDGVVTLATESGRIITAKVPTYKRPNVRKNVSGYFNETPLDAIDLFIGSEGTLGVVTRACLKLHPRPIIQSAAFCSLPSLDTAFGLLKFLRGRLGNLLSGFEVILAPLMGDMVAVLGLTAPVALSSPVYVLTDIQGMTPGADEEAFTEALAQAIEDGLVEDVVVSQSEREFQALWTLRDDCNRFLFAEGAMLSLDVSLPLPRMGEFLNMARAAQSRADPAAQDYVFGHLGDGNLHYVVRTDRPYEVAKAVFDCVAISGGSISAEHGIGLDKKAYLHLTRDAAELAAMRRLKVALDPGNILNPGRIFDMPPAPLNV